MIKDHIIAQVVNDLRDTAVKFHDTQQLRERLRGCIEPLLSAAAAAPQVVADERSAQRARVHAKLLAMPDSDMGNLIGPPAKCELPPDGWYCTRMPGHEGPCAALSAAPVQAQEPIGYAPRYLTERMAAGDSAVMLTVTRKPLPGHGVTVALYTATPAAQGDAKDAELRTLYTSPLIGAAWDRRVGSCNANKTIFESDKSHFVSGWNSALDAAIAAKAAS